MVNYLALIFAVANLAAGCIGGTILLDMTGNHWYLIINVITGGASGILFANAFQESAE